MSEHRDEYVEKLRAKMGEWKDKIDKLQERADQAEGEVKIRYQNHIGELGTKYASAEEKIGHLVDSSENTWESFLENYIIYRRQNTREAHMFGKRIDLFKLFELKVKLEP